VRKRQDRNNKSTKATQRIDYTIPDGKVTAKPKGRSIGGPWLRKKR
jgi:hypothetical protein